MAPLLSVHFLVLIHGMWGNPSQLSELARIIRDEQEDSSKDIELEVFMPETNSGDSTYDGVDWGGERLAEEVWNQYIQMHSALRRLAS